MLSPNQPNQTKRFQIIPWIIAVLIISTGIYLSNIKYLDTEWLSRAGCLIVILGIWCGIGGILQERIFLSKIKWRKSKTVERTRKRLEKEGADSAEIEKQLAEINRDFDEKAEEITQRLRTSIGILEVSLLMTGTFLWGFGDLIIT